MNINIFTISLLFMIIYCSSFTYGVIINNNNNKNTITTTDSPRPASYGSVNKYLCNVNPIFNSTLTCQPFSSSEVLRNCTNINDCINAIDGLSLTQVDILNINLMSNYFNGVDNCNLKFNLPCQVVMGPDKSVYVAPTMDCTGQASFISHLLSNLLIDSMVIQNAYDSCINVPANSNSFSVMITNSTFQNCTGQNGGAIQLTYPNSLNVRNSIFMSNNAVHSGGAIYSDGTTIVSSDFISNSAEKGGAIFSPVFTTSELLVKQSQLRSNVAELGGAIYSSEFQTSDSTFHANLASAYGGAVYSETIEATDCEFSLNSARISGGAITLDHAFRQNLIIGSNIFNNSADYSGGAIYIYAPSNKSSLTFDSSQVFFNTALEGPGGGVFLNETYNGYLISGSFYENFSPINESAEIGCDSESESYSCNFCRTPSCAECMSNSGICLTQNNQSMCMVSLHQCVHGQCSINSNNTYSCQCSPNYTGESCEQGKTTPTPSPTHTNPNSEEKQLRKLDIALPIAFGSLIILFIITLSIMIKRKDRTGGYEVIS